MEQSLRNSGYLDEGGKTLKEIKQEESPWKRVFQSGTIVELLQWRAIRHEFMFPATSDADDEHSSALEDATVLKVSEPHFFHFHEYLTEQLGENFVELVEVDVSTWICACILALLLPSILNVGEFYYPIQSAIFSWLLLLIQYFLAVHIYTIYMQVTPVQPSDPVELLQCFAGTSHAALQRKARAEKANQSATQAPTQAPTQAGPMLSVDALRQPLLQSVERQPQSSPRPDNQGAIKQAHKLKAKFRSKEQPENLREIRPWYIKFLMNHPRIFPLEWKPLPNEQEQLFLLQECGPEITLSIMELLLFL